MHQVHATNASLKSDHEPACDTAMQPALLPDEFTCHNLHVLIERLANFYKVSRTTTNLPMLLVPKKRFTNGPAGVLSSKEIPSEATASTPLPSRH